MVSGLKARVIAHFRANHEWYWVPLLYCAAVVFIYRQVFFPGDGPTQGFGWDTIETYWADLSYLASSLREHQAPLWDPYDLGGSSFIGNPTRAQYYPANWPLVGYGALVGDTSWWLIQIKMIGHHVIAGCMMHLFLRSRRLSPFAASVGGLAWVASAPLIIHKASALIWPMVWTPLLWLVADKVVEKPTWRTSVGLAAAVVVAGHAGSPPGFFYALLMAAPYGVMRFGHRVWDERADKRKLLRVAAHIALAVAGAAVLSVAMLLVVTVPAQELTSLSNRAERSVAYALQFPLPSRQTITGMWAPTTGTHDAYGGILVILLAVCALAMKPLRDRGAPILFACVGAFFLVLAFGAATPLLGWLVRHFPGFGLFRASNRYKLLMAPMLAALAAYGAANLEQAARTWSRERITALAIAAAGVVIVIVLLRQYPLGPKAFAKLHAAQSVYVVFAAAALITAVVLVPPRFRFLPMVAMLPLIVYDPQHFVHIRGPSLENRPDNQEDRKLLEGLANVETDWRIFDEFALEQRAGTRLRILELRGYPAGGSLEYTRFGAVHTYIQKHPEILAELNVRYVFHGPHHRAGKSAHWIKQPPDKLAPGVFTKLRSNLYEVINPAPIVAWYGAVVVGKPGAGRLLDDVRKAPGADGVRRYAVLEREEADRLGDLADRLIATAAASPPESVTGELLELANNRVRVRVNAPADGIVVLNEVMYPGWTVRVDGQRAEALYANWLLRGVAVNAGAHEITWTYRPKRHGLHLFLWTFGVFLMLFALFAPERAWWDKLVKRSRTDRSSRARGGSSCARAFVRGPAPWTPRPRCFASRRGR